MKWIGLTGGIACGKSTVARALVEAGYPLVDADHVARHVVRPGSEGLREVVQSFGPEILLPDGSLDRRKLGQRIFGQDQLRRKLESILHPLIRSEVELLRDGFAQQGRKIAFYDIPLLFETHQQEHFDKILVVTCSPEEQRVRMRVRDGLTDEEIEKRLAAQMPLSEKEAQADFVFNNNLPQEHFVKEFQRLIQWLDTLNV